MECQLLLTPASHFEFTFKRIFTVFFPDYDSPLLLFFIYDTEKAQRESDDPLDSIIYFHPSNGSNLERRISVVGQIVGTALCIKSLLSVPNLITLERGKFALSWSGRFILVRIFNIMRWEI